ncbi:hypothetical protein Dimus_023289 [Dionaea muscipula]
MATSLAPPPSTTSAGGASPGGTAAEPTTSEITTADVQPPPLDSSSATSTSTMAKTPMAPPPPQNPNPSNQNIPNPYTIPPWSEAPPHPFYLEVLKDGSIIDQLNITEKGAYMFGRVDVCDFILEHPTISRFHAVLQFKGSGEAYIYDLGSTHGTSINKNRVKKKVYVDLHVGDIIRFGLSSRLYIFQGPEELMPPENDLKSIRYAKLQQEKQDGEASLRRAREQATLADGISWGMGEDAVEEVEDDTEEITWQTYKGELTEKQEKTRSKVLKRMEKIAHMKKEIDAIRAKDIAQGGLTQGQQTQIARNEQRISQIMEELESLEETLNDSIQESVGARSGKNSHGKGKGVTEDEDDFMSDDDEFYDRTKKKPSTNKPGSVQTVETADSLLDKKAVIMKEMEEKKKIISDEKCKISEHEVKSETGDALDAYMIGLSSQIVLDRTKQLQEELSALETELGRILYLLKLADPTGEAAKRRETIARECKSEDSEIPPSSAIKSRKKPPSDAEKVTAHEKPQKPSNGSAEEVPKAPEVTKDATVTDTADTKTVVYNPIKPQWLGAVQDGERGRGESQLLESHVDVGDEFVDYKDRKKILGASDDSKMKVDGGLESAAPV